MIKYIIFTLLLILTASCSIYDYNIHYQKSQLHSCTKIQSIRVTEWEPVITDSSVVWEFFGSYESEILYKQDSLIIIMDSNLISYNLYETLEDSLWKNFNYGRKLNLLTLNGAKFKMYPKHSDNDSSDEILQWKDIVKNGHKYLLAIDCNSCRKFNKNVRQSEILWLYPYLINGEINDVEIEHSIIRSNKRSMSQVDLFLR